MRKTEFEQAVLEDLQGSKLILGEHEPDLTPDERKTLREKVLRSSILKNALTNPGGLRSRKEKKEDERDMGLGLG